MQQIEKHACFGGWQEVWTHESPLLNCPMRFAVYLPPQAKERKVPVLYWLSGLTCTEQNVITKSGIQRYAAEHGIMIVAPDTSPRGESVADDAAYDLGQGASFYLNATQSPWCNHYQMYDYILHELPRLITTHFAANEKKSISGHSMGGHGALVLGLRNPNDYVSVSAFSPIVSPSQVGWGQKAFTAYLGDDRAAWQQYDAVALILQGHDKKAFLVDQGLDDPFYAEQLRTQNLENACQQMHIDAQIRYHAGYDHSYYFIASWIEDHVAYHAKQLQRSIE